MSSIRTHIRSIPALISIAIAVAFCASVVYDWGYYFALGLNFADIPATFSDHTISTLVWLPPIVFGLMAGMILDVFVIRLSGRNGHIHRITTHSSILSRVNTFMSKYGLLMFSIIALILDLLIGVQNPILIIGPLAIVWIWLTRWVMGHELTVKKLTKPLILFLLSLGISIIALTLLGGGSAIVGLKSQDNVANITTNYPAIEKRDVHVLRNFTNYILVYEEKTNQLLLINDKEIAEIAWKYQSSTFHGLLGDFIAKHSHHE